MADQAQLQIPEAETLAQLEAIAKECRACPLWKLGTQTVFGEGPQTAQLMFIGEQPGDREDREGRPFVGPAGRVFDECLEAAEIAREEVYVTNTVKHFKGVPSGNRRLHSKPNLREVRACQPWMYAEIERIQPDAIVCLGATASQSLLGTSFRLTLHRGEIQNVPNLPPILATIHPSAILRMREREERDQAREDLVADFIAAKRMAAAPVNP